MTLTRLFVLNWVSAIIGRGPNASNKSDASRGAFFRKREATALKVITLDAGFIGFSPRSGRQHKAWGVSPRIALADRTKPAERAAADDLD